MERCEQESFVDPTSRARGRTSRVGGGIVARGVTMRRSSSQRGVLALAEDRPSRASDARLPLVSAQLSAVSNVTPDSCHFEQAFSDDGARARCRSLANFSFMELEDIGFHDLTIFSAFAEYEHLGRASEALGLSVPAVQRAVRSLETRLGVPLVRRDGRRIRLLHPGRILADQAARILRTRSEAIDAVLVAAGREQHVLRIGYMYSLGLRVVPDLMADVLAHRPNVRI